MKWCGQCATIVQPSNVALPETKAELCWLRIWCGTLFLSEDVVRVLRADAKRTCMKGDNSDECPFRMHLLLACICGSSLRDAQTLSMDSEKTFSPTQARE